MNMTPEAKVAANQGWDLMVKVHRHPSILLWKADDGWDGAWEIEAVPSEHQKYAKVYARRWLHANILPDYNPN